MLLRFLLTRFVAGVIRRLSQNTRYGTIFDSPALASLPRLAGSAVFWLTLLAVPSAVLERLDLNVPSELLDGLSEFLPNIFVAVLVLVLGHRRRACRPADRNIGAEHRGIAGADLVGRLGQASIVVVAAGIAGRPGRRGQHVPDADRGNRTPPRRWAAWRWRSGSARAPSSPTSSPPTTSGGCIAWASPSRWERSGQLAAGFLEGHPPEAARLLEELEPAEAAGLLARVEAAP